MWAFSLGFSIVMPSLYLYLSAMGASPSFYALVVAAFSVGEALGSIALGALSNVLGCKRTLQLCTLLAWSGSTSYALADTIHRAGVHHTLGPMVVLIARLLQGIGSGGQQTVEQTYLGIAAPPEERTNLTSKLSTFACLGFIFGPALGALVSTIPRVAVGAVRFTTFTNQGWVVAVLNVCMFVLTTCFFEEVTPEWAEADAGGANGGNGGHGELEEKGGGGGGAPRDGGRTAAGVWTCIVLFFIHFNGFAIQETITTPIVEDWFGWDDVAANLLFTAAGMANLGCALVMSILTSPRVGDDGSLSQLVGDRELLVGSLVLAVRPHPRPSPSPSPSPSS